MPAPTVIQTARRRSKLVVQGIPLLPAWRSDRSTGPTLPIMDFSLQAVN